MMKMMIIVIIMNRSIRDGSPRLLFDYVLKELELQISKSQYHAMLSVQVMMIMMMMMMMIIMMSVQSAWKFLELSRIHRRFRPPMPVMARPRFWWKYAFRVIKVHFIQPYTWASIKTHRRKYRALVALWVRRIRQVMMMMVMMTTMIMMMTGEECGSEARNEGKG